MNIALPRRRHPNCEIEDCSICSDDHTTLNNYFEIEIGYRADWLAKYRKYLDVNRIPSETFGWASIEAFDEKNILNFVDETNCERDDE
jgi:hypothetical protein